MQYISQCQCDRKEKEGKQETISSWRNSKYLPVSLWSWGWKCVLLSPCVWKKKQWSAKRYHWKSRKMRQKCTIEFLNVNKDNQWNRGEKSTRKKIHNTKVWIWDLRDGLEIKCYSGRGENPSWVPAPTWWLRTVSWLQLWHPLLVSVGIRHKYLTHTYLQSNIHIHKNTP